MGIRIDTVTGIDVMVDFNNVLANNKIKIHSIIKHGS